MRSPRDMQIIQIDITNACVHECSNCTRFCGHHRKNFFMDWITFQRAVDSLKDFKGTIGIMGGEPTLHPEFDRYISYLHRHIKYKKTKNDFIRPVENFMGKMQQQEIENRQIHKNVYGKTKNAVYGAGLWSAMPPTYYKYYERIQDVFKMQALNDHTNAMYHSPILVTRKDMGIADDKWMEIRDNCWAQQLWSASITPKGAFFCEIAASLDMLFDGPGGIPIESGWWMKEPEKFNQYNWCELCGIAFAPFSRDARDEIDDISESMYERLKAIDSPKIKADKYSLIKIDSEGNAEKGTQSGWMKMHHENAWDAFQDRMNTENDILRPKAIEGIVFCKDENIEMLSINSRHFDKMIIAADGKIAVKISRRVAEFSCEVQVMQMKTEKYGHILNRLFSAADKGGFIFLFDNNIMLVDDFRERIMKMVLNPGTMIWSKLHGNENSFVKNALEIKDADIALFSKQALSFKRLGFDNIADSKCIGDILSCWEENKVIEFTDENFVDDFPILKENCSYAIYGTGGHGESVTKQLNKLGSKILYYSDSDASKWGTKFNGKDVVSPKKLASFKDQVDKIVIASDSYCEIEEILLKVGITKEKCIIIAF